jgi:diaminohydroxyphosphoribosylaminopyrimidine deaminase/5-amino-6-(5-phosphoribosylamino)uracil reductase
MTKALRLAAKGGGLVSPNPMVGAVLVRGGKVISTGYHRRFGGPHAEVDCLRSAGGDARGSTLYVNLEPCSHHGKTPPCADLIIRSGVNRVVIAARDPNPRVAGRGIRRLRKAGVHVQTGVLEEEARRLNKSFFLHITRRRPYVHLKIAQTLDGMIAGPGGGQTWISSRQSRALVHRWRSEYDAVMVGVGTVIADDPRLTVRLHRGRQPAVIVLDGGLEIPVRATLFQADRRVFILTSTGNYIRKKPKVRMLEKMGVTIVPLNSSADALELRQALRELYRRDIGSVLVEGGREVFSRFLRDGPVDELSIFVAPTVMGHGVPAVLNTRGQRSSIRFSRWSAMPVGRDMLIQAFR